YLVLRGRAGMGAVYAVLWIGVALAAFLFTAAERRDARVLVPAAVGLALAFSTVLVQRQIAKESRAIRAFPGVGNDVSWVDSTVRRHGGAAFLFTPGLDPQALWQTEFWNRSVGSVLDLAGGDTGGIQRCPVTLD